MTVRPSAWRGLAMVWLMAVGFAVAGDVPAPSPAAAPATAGTPRIHAIPGIRLTMTVPGDWVSTAPSGGAVLVLRSPQTVVDPTAGKSPAPGVRLSPAVQADTPAAAADRDRGAVAVVLQLNPPEPDAESFARRNLADLVRIAPDCVPLEGPALVHLHGRPWWRMRYRFRVGQLQWEQIALAGIEPGAEPVGCWITWSSAAGRFADWLPTFEAVIASLGRPAAR